MPPETPERDPLARVFPTLPIVTPDPPRRPDREKYGALFYLGAGGLALVVALLGWFAWGVWTLRPTLSRVYVLHDESRSESERVGAAYALSRDPHLNQRQIWDIALRKRLPPLARYVVAEGLTAEAATADPRAFGAAVARSEGWPAWLRLLLTRPMAYAAALGLPVPRPSLRELARNPDDATALWATYALAAGPEGEPASAEELRRRARAGGPDRGLAGLLAAALDETRLEERLRALDDATAWLRAHHPEAARLWEGWRVEGDRLVRRDKPAPDLH